MSKRISASDFAFSTLIDLLRWRATQQPEQRLYTFLIDGETEKASYTYADLDRQARIIGAAIQAHIPNGERALLIYPSGLEFIAAFFGCLYGGVVAVPVYPPSTIRSDRALSKFRAIAGDAQPLAILTCESLLSRTESLLSQAPELEGAKVFVTDQLAEDMVDRWHLPASTSDTLAFLQYTSGSTGIPKGVMVTHGNLLHNATMVERFCEHSDQASGVTWLPLYHDLGLIGGVLQPLYAGYHSAIMAPVTFLQRPYRWLQAVSKWRATISGGPNFAYDLCVRKVTPEQKATLDLSSWDIIANGAEPVRLETIERFASAFAQCGLRRSYSYPCYGLAEATLVVSAGKKSVFPTSGTFLSRALEQNQAIEASPSIEAKETRTLVSIGRTQPEQRMLIVEPETGVPCQDNHIGEIWVSGPSVAQGYWHRKEETERVFHAYLNNGEGPFLRTGDLGFLRQGEVFITGRLKDLIIIRGSNYYPQDIEYTVENCHPALRSPGCAAFSVDVAGEERLVVVQEVGRTYLGQSNDHSLDEVVMTIRRAIAEEHELQVYAVILIKPATLPKTSSGKVQRRGTREAYLDSTLEIVYTWELPEEITHQAVETGLALASKDVETDQTVGTGLVPVLPPASTIQNWLITHISQELKINPRDFDIQAPFAQYGMDSARAVSISADLEDWLGRPLPATLVYDYPTIEALTHHLAGDTPFKDIETPQQTSGNGSRELTPLTTDAIAIIGLGCRFPGANSPEAFWQMLYDGVDGISEVPVGRWDVEKFYAPEQATPGKMNTRWGGFLQNIEQFDPYFFGIAPREAAGMDPQQRLLLEVAWETLENAGLAPNQLVGSQTGVFIGISSDDYSRLQFKDSRQIDAYAGTGNAHSIAANRLSYTLDLRGPSIAIDTACSSSLVAVHQACQSLRYGECDLALAGGVNVILSPEFTITFSQARMMSSAGRCKTFDEAADGYVRGEGCGLVLLKPLAAAQRDGDTILAIVRGSAVNQDGRSNGLTAPNGPSQEAVIRRALQNAGIDNPGDISYVETHGSSTILGDPIEVDSLKAVLMERRSQDQPCLLGAVKTNVGHLEAAAGIAGLIKSVLCLHKGVIAPNLHFNKLNPHISFEGTTFAVPTQPCPWPERPNGHRLAGVSAFGFGGTNAHIILEGAPSAEPTNQGGDTDLLHKAQDRHKARSLRRLPDHSLHLLVLSGRTAQALSVLARRYRDFLTINGEADRDKPQSLRVNGEADRDKPQSLRVNGEADRDKPQSLSDICYTASTGRTHFAHRLAVYAENTDQMRERLAAFVEGQPPKEVQVGQVEGRQKPIAFLFTGQGSQYVNMARQLYETQPVFRKTLDLCDRLLQPYLDQAPDRQAQDSVPMTLLSALYPALGARSPINQTAYTQPALFALEYALAEMWLSWGIKPDVVMGHSVGEYVAACVAGAFSLEDGLKLIAARGRLMQSLPERGTMVVVFAGAERVQAFVTPYQQYVSVAVLNGSNNTVISGREEVIQLVVQQLEAEGVRVHPMGVSHAFHSPLMDPMLGAFEQVAREVAFAPLRIPLVCNLTGQLLNAGEIMDAHYWRRHTREVVQFASGIQTLATNGYDLFLELGPGPVLSNMGKRCLPENSAIWLHSLHQGHDDWSILMASIASLYCSGCNLNWSNFEGDAIHHKLALPTYPFEREYCWFDRVETDTGTVSFVRNADEKDRHGVEKAVREGQTGNGVGPAHPLLDAHVALAHLSGTHVWEIALDKQRLPYLNDHRIQGAMALPVSVYVELAQAATVEVFGPGKHILAELELKKLLLLPEKGFQKVQVVLSSDTHDVSFRVYSLPETQPKHLGRKNAWTLHATGRILQQSAAREDGRLA